MKAKKDPKIFLEHILENIEKIENGINGMTENELPRGKPRGITAGVLADPCGVN